MRVKLVTLAVLLVIVVLGCTAQPSAKHTSDMAIPGFSYIRDLKMFKPEECKDLAPEARRAVRFARGIIALRLEKEIRGKFSVAQASWGYQVNFSGLEANKDDAWTEVPEGFGEVFLSKGLDKIEVDYGP
jgi:hypothetical protein